ncbi:MAG TPA: heparan-alpha-glucosaminide N-acetyltransferase domain-containing protein [Steroidobacteraceae bacterium]|nr:heparan-alpha-glucosaminide N-acetyltransferase domain-containing protein [Steroidobacteraceae bacterium]
MVESTSQTSNRIGGIDALRGLVVILMALDHAREFMAPSGFSPTDASVTTGFLYFTRWVTHLCAPTFVLLAGMSCYLICTQLGDARRYRNFVVVRGLILVAIEVSLVALGWDFEFREIRLQVIWVLGMSMVCVGLMHRLPRQVMFWLGVFLCLLSHEMLSRIDTTNPLLVILFGTGSIGNIGSIPVVVMYSLVPWLGLMMVGYGCANWVTARLREGKRATWVGLLLLAAAVLLRAFTSYGDPDGWRVIEGDPVGTMMMFFDLAKYPPSPLYLACMSGLAFTLLFTIDRAPQGVLDVLKVYGRAPLLFYVVHLYVIQIVRWAKIIWVHFGLPGYTMLPPDTLTLDDMRGLYWAYGVCAFALILLYKPCIWFYRAKKARSMRILSYL